MRDTEPGSVFQQLENRKLILELSRVQSTWSYVILCGSQLRVLLLPLFLQGHLVIVDTFWVITTGEEDDIDNLLGRGKDCYQSTYSSQDNFPQQRMIGSKIPVVRRLRNSSLNVLLSWVLLPLLRYCETIGHTFFSLPHLIIKRRWWVKNGEDSLTFHALGHSATVSILRDIFTVWGEGIEMRRKKKRFSLIFHPSGFLLWGKKCTANHLLE